MDYIKRFIIAAIMVLCVSLLFLGGRNAQAVMIEIEDPAVNLLNLFS